jgi:hypothetical protein
MRQSWITAGNNADGLSGFALTFGVRALQGDLAVGT